MDIVLTPNVEQRLRLERRWWRKIARGLGQLDKGEKAHLDMAEIKRKARELRARREAIPSAD